MANEVLVLKRTRVTDGTGKSQVALVFFLPIAPEIRDGNGQIVFPVGDSTQLPADFAAEVTPQEILDIDAGTLMWFRPRPIVQQPGENQQDLLVRVQNVLYTEAADPVDGEVARLRKEFQFFGTRVDGVAT